MSIFDEDIILVSVYRGVCPYCNGETTRVEFSVTEQVCLSCGKISYIPEFLIKEEEN